MMHEVEFTENALKELNKLEKNIQDRIIRTLERIRVRPEAYVTKLVGEEDYRLRVGNYRVIMEIKKDKLFILVIKVGHRRNIYQ